MESIREIFYARFLLKWEVFDAMKLSFPPIIFKNSSSQVSLEGRIHEFSFKKKTAFRWNRTPYLAVYYKNELMISQYENDDWREKHFDQIIAEFENAKNAMTSES